MDPNEYELMYQVEFTHGWYRGMREISEKILRICLHFGDDRTAQILDAGCGTGAGLMQLADFGKVFGIDLSAHAISFCKKRNLHRLAQATILSTPFKSETFDLITSFDVLYEDSVEDDLMALSEFNRITRPGGYLLLRLPAFHWLIGTHDRIVHTRRRYTRSEVKQLLAQAGYQLEYSTYANWILFPLVAVKRFLDRINPSSQPRSDLRIQVAGFNQFQKMMLSVEASMLPQFSLPYGSSVIALGRKTGSTHG